jgi:hypothetical protein
MDNDCEDEMNPGTESHLYTRREPAGTRSCSREVSENFGICENTVSLTLLVTFTILVKHYLYHSNILASWAEF